MRAPQARGWQLNDAMVETFPLAIDAFLIEVAIILSLTKAHTSRQLDLPLERSRRDQPAVAEASEDDGCNPDAE